MFAKNQHNPDESDAPRFWRGEWEDPCDEANIMCEVAQTAQKQETDGSAEEKHTLKRVNIDGHSVLQ